MQIVVSGSTVYLGEVTSWTPECLVMTNVAVVRMFLSSAENLASLARSQPNEEALIRFPASITIPSPEVQIKIQCVWDA